MLTTSLQAINKNPFHWCEVKRSPLLCSHSGQQEVTEAVTSQSEDLSFLQKHQTNNSLYVG